MSKENSQMQEMTMKAVVEHLQKVTGADEKVIKEVLYQHNVHQGFAAYRVVKALYLFLGKLKHYSTNRLHTIKEERIALENEMDMDALTKEHSISNNTHQIYKERSRFNLLQALTKSLKLFLKVDIAKLDKSLEYTEEVDKHAYVEISKALNKNLSKYLDKEGITKEFD